MATFQAQVQALTGVTISSSGTSPVESELTQFLNDGVIDVTSKVARLSPPELDNFIRQSAEQTSNGFNPGTGKIVSVLRESGTNNEWYPCTKKPIDLQYLVTDAESLHYASKYNPVYMISQNRNVHVFPEPSAAGNDTFKVLYINTSPEETDGTALDHASTGIKWFPEDKVYLVVLYASIKSLQSALSAVNVSTFSLTASVPTTIVAAPSISGGFVASVGIDALPTAPVYTAPVFTSASTYLTEMEDGTIGDDTHMLDVEQWFSIAGQLIEDEEDTELAQVHLQKISAFLSAFQGDMQNQLNVFNDANTEYQANIQRNLQQAQINMQDAQKEADLTLQAAIQDYTLELQRISTDAQKYQALVAAEVQVYQQEIGEKTLEYQWQVTRLQDLKQEYNQAFAIMAPQPQKAQPQSQR